MRCAWLGNGNGVFHSASQWVCACLCLCVCVCEYGCTGQMQIVHLFGTLIGISGTWCSSSRSHFLLHLLTLFHFCDNRCNYSFLFKTNSIQSTLTAYWSLLLLLLSLLYIIYACIVAVPVSSSSSSLVACERIEYVLLFNWKIHYSFFFMAFH